MANLVKLKRSAVPGKVPGTVDLELGELAVNTYDGKLFLKKNDGTEAVVELGAGGGGASVTVSDTPPANPANGDLWWDSSAGTLKIYYDDGTSSQWVDSSNISAFLAESLIGVTIQGYSSNLQIISELVPGPAGNAIVSDGTTWVSQPVAIDYIKQISYTTTGTGVEVADSFSASTYRTVKYLIQVIVDAGVYSSELLVTHNGVSAYYTEYAVLSSEEDLATFSVDLTGGSVNLKVQTAVAGGVVDLVRTTIAA